MWENVGRLFAKPFRSRLFWLVFIFVFIPVGTFGIYFKIFSPSFSGGLNGFLALFTPESLFSYIIPLIVPVVIDGVLAVTKNFDGVKNNTVKHELLRDSIILGVISLLIFVVVLYFSLVKSSLFLSFIALLYSWFMWVLVAGSRDDFSPTVGWSANGNQKGESVEELTNG